MIKLINMKKLLLFLFVLISIGANAQQGRLSNSSTGSDIIAKFNANFDTVIVKDNAALDSVSSLRSASNLNYGFIASQADSIDSLRVAINLNTAARLLIPEGTLATTDDLAGLLSTADSTGYAEGNYMTRTGVETLISAIETGTPDSLILNDGSLTIVGDDAITITTTGPTSVTLPTTGTLANTDYVNNQIAEAGTGTGLTSGDVADIVHDSITSLISGGTNLSDVAIMKADSTGALEGNYVTDYKLRTAINAIPGGSNVITDQTGNAWRVFYSDGSGNVTELSLGADGSYLRSNGPAAIPTFSTPTTTGISDAAARTIVHDSIQALRDNAVQGVALSDVNPIFVFGLGSGSLQDTAVFVNNAIAGAFFNAGNEFLVITSLRGVIAEGNGTETVSVQVSWSTTFNSGTSTHLNASAYTITSTTTGNNDTIFDNATIPPNVWVWCTISGITAGNQPSMLNLTLSGYKTR